MTTTSFLESLKETPQLNSLSTQELNRSQPENPVTMTTSLPITETQTTPVPETETEKESTNPDAERQTNTTLIASQSQTQTQTIHTPPLTLLTPLAPFSTRNSNLSENEGDQQPHNHLTKPLLKNSFSLPTWITDSSIPEYPDFVSDISSMLRDQHTINQNNATLATMNIIIHWANVHRIKKLWKSYNNVLSDLERGIKTVSSLSSKVTHQETLISDLKSQVSSLEISLAIQTQNFKKLETQMVSNSTFFQSALNSHKQRLLQTERLLAHNVSLISQYETKRLGQDLLIDGFLGLLSLWISSSFPLFEIPSRALAKFVIWIFFHPAKLALLASQDRQRRTPGYNSIVATKQRLQREQFRFRRNRLHSVFSYCLKLTIAYFLFSRMRSQLQSIGIHHGFGTFSRYFKHLTTSFRKIDDSFPPSADQNLATGSTPKSKS